MEVIFSKEFQRQLDIVRLVIDKGNIDFYALYNCIGLCVKALESVNCIDDLRFHEGNQDKIGHLGKPLEKCLALLHDTWSEPTTVCIESFAIMWFV